jgi:hypothetical protein
MEFMQKKLKENRFKPHHLTEMLAKHPCDLKNLTLKHFAEEPAMEYLLKLRLYDSSLWFLEQCGITPNTTALQLLEIHLRSGRKREHGREEWERVLQALLDTTTSLPADSPDLLRLAMEACHKKAHFVAQIIDKGVDPDIASSDGMDALAYLRWSVKEGGLWAKGATELEQVLVASMVSQRRGKKRKAADPALEDVSGSIKHRLNQGQSFVRLGTAAQHTSLRLAGHAAHVTSSRQMSAIRKIRSALDLKLTINGALVVEVCSQLMAERSEYFKGLLANPMAEQANKTVNLTKVCQEHSFAAADVKWVVESVEKGQALPLPDQGEPGNDPEVPVLIRLLRAADYFGT